MSDTWTTSDGEWKELKPPDEREQKIIAEAKKRFKACVDWEAQARIWFEYDYKFANGDTHNKYQWDNEILNTRENDDRPCLTINKTKIHNLMVINDAKQNKPGVRIRPVGEKASFDGAQIYQELVYHIEYISNAESVYDSATVFQVEAGIGYWRIETDYVSDDSFDQEIYIRRIKDPRSVYLDPNINEIDGSDAGFGFIFEDMPKDLFKETYPDFTSIGSNIALGNIQDDWITKNNIRICEYYRKIQKKDKLVAFVDPQSEQQVITHYSKLSPEGKQLANELKKAKDQSYKERKVIRDDIEWFKIAGDRIINEGPWLGKYIPIVRLVGTETIIDGILDRKGHTRGLINAQQMYNYNSSANIEFGALQTKSPWLAPSEAVEDYEEYWKPLALNTPLPTPNGWTTMGEVKINDWLFDENGAPVQVVGLSPIHLYRKCYRVEFDDGSHIIADEDHLWTIEKRKRKVNNAKDWITCTVPTKLLQIKKDYIWCSKPLDLERKNLLIDPYVLGVWLGDGSTASNRIHCDKNDADELINNLSNKGYQIGNAREQKTCVDITIHGLRNHLVSFGLLGNKHIPEVYLRASYEQRLELLQGLMDTDGHYHKATKRCIFFNNDKQIIDGIFELLRTLGIKSITRKFEGRVACSSDGKTYIGKDSYRVSFSTDVNIFKFNRKGCLQNKSRKFNWRRVKRFKIVSLTEVLSVPVRCVAINSVSHLFLAGTGMIPTHNTANTENRSYLPYNHMGEDGQPIPSPTRPQPPQPSPAYVQGLQIAQNEMMMTSGQYQSQVGENENAKSGVAINARQRQGDRITYHFIDNQAVAIRLTGKILIDLIPKIYDTKRVKQIQATDGSILNLTVDPEAEEEFIKDMPEDGKPQMHKGQQIIDVIFNPQFGQYDIISDTGPSFATRRQEAFNALTQIAASNKDFMSIAGDILWDVADFPKADILSQRYRKVIPPNILGEGIDKETSDLMEKASQQIEGLNKQLQELGQKLADRSEEFDIKRSELKLRTDEATATQHRLDYDAENKRLTALGNSGPAVSVEQIQPIVQQLLEGMMNNGEPSSGNIPMKTAKDIAGEQGMMNAAVNSPEPEEEQPPVEGAQKAPDGNWYVKNEDEGYSRVEPDEEEQQPKLEMSEEVDEFHPEKIGAKQAPDGQYYVPHAENPGEFLRVEH